MAEEIIDVFENIDKLCAAGNFFSYANNAYKCSYTIKIHNNKKIDYLLLEPEDSINYYGFAPKTAMIKSNDQDNTVLSSFLSFPFGDNDAIIELINKYGFLISLDCKKMYTVKAYELNMVLSRLKYLAKLATDIHEIDELTSIRRRKTIVDEIFDYTTLLIFEDQLKMKPYNNDIIFSVIETNPVHRAIWNDFDFMNHYNHYNDDNNTIENGQNNQKYSYRFKLDNHRNNYFYDIINNREKIVLPDNAEERDYVTDVLSFFYIANDILYQKYNINFFVTKTGFINSPFGFWDFFNDDEFAINTLIKIAKTTIKYEFDYAIKGIHPIYNTDTLSADWEIPSFLSALYFALFYKSKDSIYRFCANPKCDNAFKVSRTNFKKKYCCTECQNRAAQARCRDKKKLNASK